ncbi:MAG: hypothetical protein ACI35O_02815 [Bacillaceae bacterium]
MKKLIANAGIYIVVFIIVGMLLKGNDIFTSNFLISLLVSGTVFSIILYSVMKWTKSN